MVSGKPELIYFGLAGRAEPIRMALGLKGVQFTDTRLDFPTFGAKKAAGDFPLGSVPVWHEDGLVICQSNVILRMVGQRHGMYSTNSDTAWAIDSTMEYAEDCFAAMAKKNKTAPGGDFQAEDLANVMELHTKMCEMIERRLSMHGKKFIAGTNDVTVGDVKLSHMFYNNVYNEALGLSDDQRNQLKANIAKYKKAEQYIDVTMRQVLANYLKTRPPCPA